VKHGRALRGETLLGGGGGRRPSHRQRWLRADESEMDAGVGRHRVDLADGEGFHFRGNGQFLFRVQAVNAQGPDGRDKRRGRRLSLKQKSSSSAPRNAPLRTGRKPGAETALFLYHRYFPGAQRPDGERI
jgi:hypothetical protein